MSAFHQLLICNDGLATPSTVLCSKAASAEWVERLHGGVCWSAVDSHLLSSYGKWDTRAPWTICMTGLDG